MVYQYNAKFLGITDDTIDLLIDLGFDIFINRRLRLISGETVKSILSNVDVGATISIVTSMEYDTNKIRMYKATIILSIEGVQASVDASMADQK